MKLIMTKNIVLMLSVLTLFSCNNNADKKVGLRTKLNDSKVTQTHSASADNTFAAPQSGDSKLISSDFSKRLSSDQSKVSSTDSTKVASADLTKVSSSDNSKVVSTDQSKSSSADQSKKITEQKMTAPKAEPPKAPIEVTPGAESGKTTVVKEQGKPAVAVEVLKEQKNNLKFSEIKILDETLIKNVDKQDFRMLFENYLAIETRAKQMIEKRKFGMACKFDVQGELVKGQVMKFSKIELTTKDKEKWMAIQFEDQKKSLVINCLYDGDFDQKYLVDNFYDVIDFKNDKGQFPSLTEKKLSYDEIVKKTKSMKIINKDVLMKAHVNASESGEKFGLIAGQLVNETESILKVQMGRAKQACAIIGVKGDIVNGMVFKQVGMKPDIEDKDNNYATMQIYYATDKGEELALECALRRNGVGPEIIFETLKGLAEYGVK